MAIPIPSRNTEILVVNETKEVRELLYAREGRPGPGFYEYMQSIGYTGTQAQLNQVMLALVNGTQPGPDPLPELTAPAITVTEVTHNSITAQTTDPDNLGNFVWFLDGVEVGTGTQLEYTYTGVTPETQYSLTNAAYDAANDRLSPISAPIMVTTLAEPVEPPVYTPPTLTEVSKTDTTISLSANNPDNLNWIELYQDGDLVAQGGDFEWALEQQTPDTEYDFSARTRDDQGNWSEMGPVLSVRTDEAGEVVVPDLSDVEKVVIVGASIMAGAYGTTLVSPNAEATAIMQAAGYTGVSVYGFGHSGFNSEQIEPKLMEARDAFDHEKTLFILHIGGNDLGNLRPYDPDNESGLTMFSNRLNNLVDVMQGTNFILADLTFRTYSDTNTPESIAQFENDIEGSGPFNENIYKPIWASKFDTGYLMSNGYPAINFYGMVKRLYRQMLSSDGSHLNNNGNQELRYQLPRRIGYLFENGAMPVPYTVPEMPLLLATFTDIEENYFDNTINRVTLNDSINNGTLVPVVDSEGNSGYTFKFISATEFTQAPVGRQNCPRGVYDGTELNCRILQHRSVLNSSDVTLEVGGLQPETVYEIAYVASRSTNGDRPIKLVTNLGESPVYQQLGADADFISQDQVTVQFLTDSSGVGSILFNRISNACYLGAISIREVA